MSALVISLMLLSIVILLLGEVFDYCEWKYGIPPRLPLRWKYLMILPALLVLIASIVIAIYEHSNSSP